MDNSGNVHSLKTVSSKDSHTMQYLKVPDSVIRFYEKLADESGVSVNETHTAALQWYMKKRGKSKHHYHLAPSANDKYKILWMQSSAINRAQTIAERDGVSVNEIVISALLTYCAYCQTTNDNTEIITFPQQDNKV